MVDIIFVSAARLRITLHIAVSNTDSPLSISWRVTAEELLKSDDTYPIGNKKSTNGTNWLIAGTGIVVTLFATEIPNINITKRYRPYICYVESSLKPNL